MCALCIQTRAQRRPRLIFQTTSLHFYAWLGAAKDKRIKVLENKILVQSQKTIENTNQLTKLSSELDITREDFNNTIDNKVDGLNTQLQDFDKWTKLVTAQESCAQIYLMGVSEIQMEKIDPDGKGANNDPIEVSLYIRGCIV